MIAPTIRAVVFDLDGVITHTAKVHSLAWTQTFNEYLQRREKAYGEKHRLFTHADDYLPYVDGKPRYKGVASFLESRGIKLPEGTPDDADALETICGIGNRKNTVFNELVATQGVDVYQSTIAFIRQLKEEGIRVGVASSSKNCGPILDKAGLSALFETRVDGIESVKRGLKGKPEPDIFVEACRDLGVTPDEAVVVEDAVSGVQAGRNGHFGLVLGLAREENDKELLFHGADMVVKDMSEITLDQVKKKFQKSVWEIVWHGFELKGEKSREALLTVGNGYFGTRGAAEEAVDNGTSYPGTYMAGVYDRLSSKVADKEVWNEDLVNCPNWLPVRFRIDNGDWFDYTNATIKHLSRTLDLSGGIMSREMTVEDKAGHVIRIASERFGAMHNPHLAALQYKITPENFSGRITIRSGLDGNLINGGVERYKSLASRHLKDGTVAENGGVISLSVETVESNITLGMAAIHSVMLDGKPLTSAQPKYSTEKTAIFMELECTVNSGSTLRLEKKVAMHHTSNDMLSVKPMDASIELVKKNSNYADMKEQSINAWEELWQQMDISVEGDKYSQKLLRLHAYHLLVTTSIHHKGLDAGIPARGLHGEAYRGHIFWDELYILPFYYIHFPEVAKSVLMYRYRRLDAARAYAKEYGYKGAMFPWQSGRSGNEETQTLHLNPLTGKWGADHSSLQRHVSLAIAYNVWNYYSITEDKAFVEEAGAELFLEICRFWASKSEWNEKRKSYDIDRVMGPDEFHEMYPNAEKGGLKNNSYTNIMVCWSFDRAFDLLSSLDAGARREVCRRIALTDSEIAEWKKIRKALYLDISKDGILAQYEGYFDLKELDWDFFRGKYKDVYRMDRLLKAENLSPDDYKVAKQADALMTFYTLPYEEVEAIINSLGYQIDKDFFRKNYEYYLARTSHGSTLSRLVHAAIATLLPGAASGWDMYQVALSSDFTDLQGGTTAEGIHAGVMAGTILVPIQYYAGVEIRKNVLEIRPNLPKQWKSISFRMKFRGSQYAITVMHGIVEIKLESGKMPATIKICEKTRTLEVGKTLLEVI